MMDSYQMTAYTDCAGDMLEVEALRDVVKNVNKTIGFFITGGRARVI